MVSNKIPISQLGAVHLTLKICNGITS